MKKYMLGALGVVAVCGIVALAGCGQPSSPGPAEKAGAALDRAAEKTVEVTTNAAAKVVEKTGEVLQKSGAAVEKAGENLQK